MPRFLRQGLCLPTAGSPWRKKTQQNRTGGGGGYIAQCMGCVIGRIHMALRSYFVLDIFCLPLSSLCKKTTHRHWIHINFCRVSCGSVFKHAASPFDYLLFSLQYMGLYVFNWPISVLGDWKDISIAHVIIIIKSELSTFPIVIIIFRGCVLEIFVTSYSVT